MQREEATWKGVLTFLAIPRSITLMALTPTISLQARTHKPHSTQAFSWGSLKRTSFTPSSSPSASISGVLYEPARINSAVIRRLRFTSSVSVKMTAPSSQGWTQDATRRGGRPGMVTSTMQSRQPP